MVDAPLKKDGSKAAVARRAAGSPPGPRRDLADDYARKSRVAAAAARSSDQPEDRQATYAPRRFSGLRFRLKGGVPRSWAGRLLAGGLVLASLAGISAVLWEARSLLLHDPRLVLASSSAVQISGNQHVTRAQLLSVFGGDVDRNLLSVPMDERRAQLEALPWVEHATVMRLLPNHVRVAIVERTPVAFVRQGNHIGLVDAHGVLLDMAADASEDDHYSFPVITGLNADDPLSTRAARMQLYGRFTSALDQDGGAISKGLSEVDLSSPEDVKALVPVDGSAILVHFGQDDFLPRYKRFQSNLPGWKSEYPKLASVDMRYDRQVVLEMAKGAGVPVADAGSAATATDLVKAPQARAAAPARAEVHARPAAAKKARVKAKSAPPSHAKAAARSAAKPKAQNKPAPKFTPPAPDEPAWEKRLNGTPGQHLQKSFAVSPGGGHPSSEGQP